MMARTGLSIVLILVAFSCGNKPLPEAENANVGDPESVLAEAIAKGDLQTVQSVLDSNPDALYSVDMMGQTPLHYAARSNSPEIVELLLDRGADPTIMNDEGVTAADTARSVGASQEIIDLLQGQQ